ncbi:hypothetical protein SDC9_165158 [bioreactor metagenome]|uniref:Uncharacterized protein n=1 Tax=bioreactor metagenome TaxID=1076179 RepID=A0A645G0U1_9ZZZZ|nr:hypothetical protein [Romboutsia lituseburensis]
MANKININGKEYSEREIKTIVINGIEQSSNVISSANNKGGENISVDLTVSTEYNKEPIVESQDIKAMQSIENIDVKENSSKQSYINRIFKSITNFIKKILKR